MAGLSCALIKAWGDCVYFITLLLTWGSPPPKKPLWCQWCVLVPLLHVRGLMKMRLWQDFLKCQVQRREKGELQKQQERMVVQCGHGSCLSDGNRAKGPPNTESWLILPPLQTPRGLLLFLPLESMQFLVHSIYFYSPIIRISILYG